MLEMIAWYGGFNLKATYRTRRFRLTHVICEDVGVVFGHAIRQTVERRIPNGVASDGSGFGGIDDALAFSYVVLEGRANHFLELPESLLGPARSRMPTTPTSPSSSKASPRAAARPYTCGWSPAATRTTGGRRASAPLRKALRAALAPDPWRAGATAGVKEARSTNAARLPSAPSRARSFPSGRLRGGRPPSAAGSDRERQSERA